MKQSISWASTSFFVRLRLCVITWLAGIYSREFGKSSGYFALSVNLIWYGNHHWIEWCVLWYPLYIFMDDVNITGKSFRLTSLGGFTTLTHWGRVTHICVGKLTILGSDNGLSPGRRQAIIWTNAGILLIGSLGTNFSEILIEIKTFSFKKMRLKVSSAKWRPFCLGLNVLTLSLLRDVKVYIQVPFFKFILRIDILSSSSEIGLM